MRPVLVIVPSFITKTSHLLIMIRERSRSLRLPRDVDKRALVVELAVILAVLVGIQVYVNLLDSIVRPVKPLAETVGLDRHFAGTAVRGLLVLGGLGAFAAAFASARNSSIPRSIPSRDAVGLITLASVAGALLALGTLLPAAIVYGLDPDHLVAGLAAVPGTLFGRTAISIAVFVGGMTILYHGLVQGALGHLFDRDRTVVATVLLSAYVVTPQFGISAMPIHGGPWLTLTPERTVVAVLCLVAAVASLYTYQAADDSRIQRVALLPVGLALVLAVVVLAVRITTPWDLLAVTTRIALVGVAAYASARSESLLGAAATYGAYALVSLIGHSVAIAAVFGG